MRYACCVCPDWTLNQVSQLDQLGIQDDRSQETACIKMTLLGRHGLLHNIFLQAVTKVMLR